MFRGITLQLYAASAISWFALPEEETKNIQVVVNALGSERMNEIRISVSSPDERFAIVISADVLCSRHRCRTQKG